MYQPNSFSNSICFGAFPKSVLRTTLGAGFRQSLSPHKLIEILKTLPFGEMPQAEGLSEGAKSSDKCLNP